MYDDLSILYREINNDLCFGKTYFIEKDYYDEKIFPNIEIGYEYDYSEELENFFNRKKKMLNLLKIKNYRR